LLREKKAEIQQDNEKQKDWLFVVIHWLHGVKSLVPG
jgi:hypothetical protein